MSASLYASWMKTDEIKDCNWDRQTCGSSELLPRSDIPEDLDPELLNFDGLERMLQSLASVSVSDWLNGHHNETSTYIFAIDAKSVDHFIAYTKLMLSSAVNLDKNPALREKILIPVFGTWEDDDIISIAHVLVRLQKLARALEKFPEYSAIFEIGW